MYFIRDRSYRAGMSRPSRRTVCAALAIVPLAGCSALESFTGGPEPRVTDTQSGQSLGDALTGSVQIQVLVVNEGDTGDVKITVKTMDGNGNTLDNYSQVVEIEEGESRRVDFNLSPSRGAERYEAEAEAA